MERAFLTSRNLQLLANRIHVAELAKSAAGVMFFPQRWLNIVYAKKEVRFVVPKLR